MPLPQPAPHIKDPEIRRAFEILWSQRHVEWGYASVASAAALTLPDTATVVNVTGATNITSVTASGAGRIVVLKFEGVLVFTDGSNLKLAGNFTTSADDTITIASDGTNWCEMARSTN